MTKYELLAVLPGTLTEAEAAPITTSIQETIEKFGVTGLFFKDMGKSRLAYPMKHIRYGYFLIWQFSVETNKIKEIEHKIRLINNILRLMVRVYNEKNIVDVSQLSITPLANVVSQDENAPAPREFRRDIAIKPLLETVPTTTVAVSMEEIEEKLDQILEKDLEKV